MATNKLAVQYAKACQKMEKEIKQVTPAVYASIGIALHEFHLSDEQIEAIFERSQRLWEDNEECNTLERMMEYFEEVTGITIMSKENHI